MPHELALLPQGHLHCYLETNRTTEDTVTKAFARHTGEGLFLLANLTDSTNLSTSVYYWRDFAKQYMTERCHASDYATEALEPLAPVLAYTTLLQNSPPMTGAEYLSQEMLDHLWQTLDAWVCAEVKAIGGKLADFLKKKAPQWRQVGRICFHLAENKQDPECPFAFIATYVPQVSHGGKTQHLPLGKALQEYAGAKNKKALVNLLSPVQLAAESSACMHALVDSGDIYYPLAWNTQEAYQFLKDVTHYETCGIVVKLPNWWKQRSKPKVSVTLETPSQKKFDVDAMLDFNLSLVLGDQTLSQQEWDELMHAQDGLVQIRGQWVEVDKAQLTKALAHWQALQATYAGEGISFIEGMRLLAGAPADLGTKTGAIEEQAWSFIHAGDSLTTLLHTLQQPEHAKTPPLGKALKANLRPYQALGVNWLYQLTQLRLGACLADDMGLGKTLQVIALLLQLKRKRAKHTSLLVLPASLLGNWKSEMDTFAPSLRYLMLHPSQTPKSTLDDMAQNPEIHPYDLLVSTYGMLSKQSWLLHQNWYLLILDEAQAIKNPGTQQTKTVKKINAHARVALTGTPIENKLGDLWSLFDFICPGLLGTPTAFKQFIQTLQSREQQQYAPLRKLVQPYILRRLKTDKSIINDLPDKTEVHAYCHLTKKQAALYRQSVQDLSVALNGPVGIQRRGLVLSYLLRFKQICNHPSQLIGDGLYSAKDSGKFSRLAEICEEIASRQEKVLIFTQFRDITNPLATFLSTIFGHPGLVLHGGTAVKKRKTLVDQFQQDNGPPFFILSIKAGGTGLNLTAASHVIHFDRWWNPAVENQATDRAFRIGQKNNVLVHKFVCTGTIEEKIDVLINDKTALAEDLLAGNNEKLITEMSNEALINMVTLDVNQIIA